MSRDEARTLAVVGSGPAGLMAATVAARAGLAVHLLEKRKGPGHKLLVAGSSGLNITHDAPAEEFYAAYRGSAARFERALTQFSPAAWIAFIESLGIATFKGTSRRYFVEEMKASGLLRAWLSLLESLGARISYGHELADFESTSPHEVSLSFTNGHTFKAGAAILALGGASWEPRETPLRWPAVFTRKQLAFTPFVASNVGYRVSWPPKFLAEAEGQPLKNISLTTSRGTKRGDLVITSYGLEGTPIYSLGVTGEAHLDLKPDLDAAAIHERLSRGKENLSPLKRIKKHLGLAPAAFALAAQLAPADVLAAHDRLAAWLKRVPIALEGPQPLEEAISSSGGVSWDELDDSLMLRRHPAVYCAGEMIDWDAPTGGFLIQGSVSQGFVAGTAAAARICQEFSNRD